MSPRAYPKVPDRLERLRVKSPHLLEFRGLVMLAYLELSDRLERLQVFFFFF